MVVTNMKLIQSDFYFLNHLYHVENRFKEHGLFWWPDGRQHGLVRLGCGEKRIRFLDFVRDRCLYSIIVDPG